MVSDEDRREHELRRALLLAALRAETGATASNFANQLVGIALPNHRLNGIANSFAWHAQRPQPRARLDYGIAEIKRLQQRLDRQSAERAVYSWLLSQIGGVPRPSATEQRLLDPLRLAEHEQAEWLDRARLLRAQSLTQLLIVFVQSTAVSEALARVGGSLQWK